jgi:putative membrane protein
VGQRPEPPNPRPRGLWFGLAVVILAQIAYPLTGGSVRAGLVVATVTAGFALSVAHAALTRGAAVALVLVAVTTLGGLSVEAVGVATGFPFGRYSYGTALGPALLGVPLVIPLAWTWMAWPAWIAAGHLTGNRAVRVIIAATGLAAWDLFLDPQMVAEGYWTWASGAAALPGVPGVPVRNYVAWFGVAALMMTALSALVKTAGDPARGADGPMLALYLWTYGSSVLAHAVFLDLPGSAAWGALGMGVVAVPLAVRLLRSPRGVVHR